MKCSQKIAMLAVMAVVAFGLFGLLSPFKEPRSPIRTSDQLHDLRQIAAHEFGDVFLLNLSGDDYLVVLGYGKAAICPVKDQPLAKIEQLEGETQFHEATTR